MFLRMMATFGIGMVLAAQSEEDPAMSRIMATLPMELRGSGNIGFTQAAVRRGPGSNWEFVTSIPVPAQPANPGPPISVSRLSHKVPGAAKKAYAQAGKRIREGKPELAIESYQKALAIDPAYVEAHCDLGALLIQLDRVTEAAAEFRLALKLAPEMSLLHANLGWTLLALGNMRDAEASAREALRLSNDNAAAHRLLGHILATEPATHAESVQHFEAALRIVSEIAVRQQAR
jgi:tetratricopeptide (TPR) repeat protein